MFMNFLYESMSISNSARAFTCNFSPIHVFLWTYKCNASRTCIIKTPVSFTIINDLLDYVMKGNMHFLEKNCPGFQHTLPSVFPASWGNQETRWKTIFHFSSQGLLRKFEKSVKNQGKLGEFVPDPFCNSYEMHI